MSDTIFVAAHNGGYEGHSLPLIAFKTKDEGLLWMQSQTELFDLVEVPIFPNLPSTTWLYLEPLPRKKVEEWPF